MIHFYNFDFERLLRGDAKSEMEYYARGRQWGFFNANEFRARKNLPFYEGGDAYLTPLNMVDAQNLEQNNGDQSSDNTDNPEKHEKGQ